MDDARDMPPVEMEKDGDPPIDGLPQRLLSVLFSPGKLMDQLAARPVWLGALLVSSILVGISVALIPTEMMLEAQRQAALERGVEFNMPEAAIRVMRIVTPIVTVLSTLIFTAIFAGLYTLIFAFVLGDDGSFKQYLAVVSHAWFIAALFGLLITPLRISTGDAQLTLNLSNLLFFLPDGYVLNVFRMLDLTQIWSTLVIAQGVHAIDRRRSFGSAAAILLTILLIVALILARFI